MSFTAAILVGGRGQRVGGAVKPLLPFRGRPILDLQLDVLRSRAAELLLVTSNAEPFASYGLRTVADVSPGQGPLAGVCAVLAAASTDWVFVVAGDMPRLSGEVIDAIEERALRAAQADVVCPIIDDNPQVLHAFYARRSRSRFDEFFQSGERSLRAVVNKSDRLNVEWVSQGELRQIDAELAFVTNINRLHELE